MKSLLIIINWLLAFCAMSIDTELSPLWAVVSCAAWFGVASWLLVKYAGPTDALRGLVGIRRFWRLLWRPRRQSRRALIEEHYRGLRYERPSYIRWLGKPQTGAGAKQLKIKN